MVDDNGVPITTVGPAGIDHDACVYRVNVVSRSTSVIEPIMHRRVVFVATDLAGIGWQLESAASDRPGSGLGKCSKIER